MSVSTQKMPELVVARYYQSRRLSHTFYTAHTQVRTDSCAKWRPSKPETALRLVDSLSDSYGEYVYSKGSSAIENKDDLCANHGL